MTSALTRLATYGTLAPGRANNHVLDGLNGSWSEGTVNGTLFEDGWGAAQGYPGLVLDPQGAAVGVFVFHSLDLPDHWDRLDRFEGSDYQRKTVTVKTPEGRIEAQVYTVIRRI